MKALTKFTGGKKMENTLSVTLMIAFLLIGAVGGAVLAPQDDAEIEYVDRVEYVNNTVETIVEIAAPNLLDLALAEFLLEVEADDDLEILGDYNFDELSVSKVYDDYTVSYEGDETIVEFDVKIRLKEDDYRAEKDVYKVEVIFEDGEDAVVSLITED